MRYLGIILTFLITSATTSWSQESSEERMNELIDLQEKAKELDTLKQAWSAYKKGKYEAAFGMWMPLAKTGNPSAQTLIGLMYNQGGSSLEQDIGEAAKWYALASEQGHAPAKWRLAMLYYHGSGLTQNYKKAAGLYLSAAKRGDTYSQKSIGVMYSKGLGVPKDNILAYSWLHIANENGFKLSQKYKKQIAKEMTSDETAIAQAVANECMRSKYTNCDWTSNSDPKINQDKS